MERLAMDLAGPLHSRSCIAVRARTSGQRWCWRCVGCSEYTSTDYQVPPAERWVHRTKFQDAGTVPESGVQGDEAGVGRVTGLSGHLVVIRQGPRNQADGSRSMQHSGPGEGPGLPTRVARGHRCSGPSQPKMEGRDKNSLGTSACSAEDGVDTKAGEGGVPNETRAVGEPLCMEPKSRR